MLYSPADFSPSQAKAMLFPSGETLGSVWCPGKDVKGTADANCDPLGPDRESKNQTSPTVNSKIPAATKATMRLRGLFLPVVFLMRPGGGSKPETATAERP